MKKAFLFLLVLASIVSTTSASAQNLNWSNNWGVSNVTDVYTANGRPGVASAYFNNQIWVAYTSNTCYSGGCAIKLTYSAVGTSLSFSTPAIASIPNGVGSAVSGNSPALTAQNGYLYLAWNDGQNVNWLTRSPDGVNWSTPYQLASGYQTTWAPSLAADPFNPNRIYAGYASSSTYTPIICAVYPDSTYLQNSTQTCLNFSYLSQMNFNPGLFYWNAINSGVIMAYEWRGDQHCLSGYILDPETGYSFDYNASQNCSDQTSVAPSLAAYGSQLFLAWGGNNGNRQFNVRHTDSYELDFIYKQTLPEGMNGSPNLLEVYNGVVPEMLLNFYVWNGQLRYMYGQ